MLTVSKKERLLILAGLLLVLLASQATSMLIFGDGTTGGQDGQTQQQQQQQRQNGDFDIQGQMNNNDDFSNIQELVDNGFDNSTALTSNSFGKRLRLRIRELFTSHKQAMEEIRLRMRLFNEDIKQKKEELISVFRRVRAELRERVRISLQEIRILKQKLNNGTISQEEYNAELQKIRLELRSYFNLMLKLGVEVGKLGKEIANRNREFAQQLFQERHEFRVELDQMLREALEAWRGRGPP